MDPKLLVNVFIASMVAMIMLAMGLGLGLADFARIARKPRPAAAGVLCQLLLLPAAGFACAWAFGLGAELAIGLVLLTACPGGAHSNLFTNLAGGDVALSVSLTAVSAVVTLVTIPLVTSLAISVFADGDLQVELPILETMARILVVVGLPLALGMGLRAGNVALATRLEPWIKGLAVAMLLLLILLSVAGNATKVGDFFAEVGVAVVVLNLSTMALGGWVARALALPFEQVVAIILEVGVQNSVLAVGLAMATLGGDDPARGIAFAVPAITYSLWVYLSAGALILYSRRRLAARSDQG